MVKVSVKICKIQIIEPNEFCEPARRCVLSSIQHMGIINVGPNICNKGLLSWLEKSAKINRTEQNQVCFEIVLCVESSRGIGV